jgi:hypothetical protein
MQLLYKNLALLLLPVIFVGLSACSSTGTSQRPHTTAATIEGKTASGTVVIDEYQIMWMVGGDIGGGTLEFQGQSHKFKMGGLKLGGFGAHKVKLAGDVWDLKDLADFSGLYAEAEIGFTVADAGKGDFWLVNDKGVKLRLKSPSSMGVALDLGVEGVDIRLEK